LTKSTTIPLETLIQIIDSFFKRESKFKKILLRPVMQNKIVQQYDVDELTVLFNLPLTIFLRKTSKHVTYNSIQKSDTLFQSHVTVRRDVIGIDNPMLYLKLYQVYMSDQSQFGKRKIEVNYKKIEGDLDVIQNDVDDIYDDLMSNIIDITNNDEKSNSEENGVPQRIRHSKTMVKQNPRLAYHQPLNITYMEERSPTQIGKRDINHLVCPICATEYDLDGRIFTFKDNKVYFGCNHEGTIFEAYKPFSMDIDLFELSKIPEDLDVFQSRFRQNVQPFYENKKDCIQILTVNNKLITPIMDFLPTIKISKQEVADASENTLDQFIDYRCPICLKSNNFCMDEGRGTVNTQVFNVTYKYYKDVFHEDNNVLYLNCDHAGTDFERYQRFFVKNTSTNLITNLLSMTKKYYGAYINREKMIIRNFSDGSREFLSLANYE